jgi:adenine phosphoribosyltransferase
MNLELQTTSKVSISALLDQTIRTIPDFPKPGIQFKDITPILANPELCEQIVHIMADYFREHRLDAIVAVESRGFLFGMQLASALKIPFVPIRKQGKLPADTIAQSYTLEYGEATIEIHSDAFAEGSRILIHDDLLATGGTVVAASELVKKLGGNIVGFAFLINLDFLQGKERLIPYCKDIFTLIDY